jgi:hypothetical protein
MKLTREAWAALSKKIGIEKPKKKQLLKAAKEELKQAKTMYTAQLCAFCDARTLPRPAEEWKFHHDRGWRFDWAWLMLLSGKNLALELDGGTWIKGGGGHNTGQGYQDDRIKDAEAMCLGWRVLRVTTQDWESGRVWGWLEKLLI